MSEGLDRHQSYLLHPESRRIQYGGGFRMIQQNHHGSNDKEFKSIQNPSAVVKLSNSIQNMDQIVQSGEAAPKSVEAKSHKSDYNYYHYHGNEQFSSLYNTQSQIHFDINHDINCQICNVSQLVQKVTCNDCPVCLGTYNTNYRPSTNYKRKPSSHGSRVSSSKRQQSRQVYNYSRPAQQPTSPQQHVSKQVGIMSQKQKSVPSQYQYIQQPLKPTNPSASQQIQYQRKYKQYLLNKRDLYYLTILRRLIDKIDFERYQCTSPNQQRVIADWFGIYKPRVLTTTTGKVVYQQGFRPGYQLLKNFIFIYVAQGNYKQKENYEVNAQLFLNHLQQLIKETQKVEPMKALQKLNKEAYKKILREKISKQAMRIFLKKMNFILMAFGINNLEDRLVKLPEQIKFQEFSKIFVMKVEPMKTQKKQIMQIKQNIEKGRSTREDNQQKFSFKAIFPEIEQLEHQQMPRREELSDTKKLSIREKKLLADLIEKQMEEKAVINYKFKAKQVPKDVLDKNLYGRLLDEQAKKSAKNREESVKTLLQNENPFSFYYRDQHKQKPAQQLKQFQSFKASPVPNHVKELRYQQIVESKQKLRNEHLMTRQQELLRSSKFPATMTYLQNNPGKKVVKQKPPFAFRPEISGQMPNFKQLHQKNVSELQQRISMNKTITTPQEFNLSKPNKKAEIEAVQFKQHPVQKHMKIPSGNQRQYLSASTLKFDALVEMRRKQVQQRQMIEASKQTEGKPKYTRNTSLLKERLDQTLKENGHTPVGKYITVDSDWNERKDEMMRKVYKESPLLVDRKYERVDGRKVEVIEHKEN